MAAVGLPAQTEPVGIFTGHQDVGTVLHAGSAEFDAAHNTYAVAGSGENMWFASDNFHYVWKKVSGDVALTAEIALLGTTGDNHRKAALMMRQTLEGDAMAADLAVHGDGLTSLQFRDAAGADMREVQTNVAAPGKVRIEKRGDFIYAFVEGTDGKLHPSGAATRIQFTGEFYIGLGVCAHNKDAVQKAVFSNVRLEQLAPPKGKLVLLSTLEAVPVAGDRRVQYVAAAHFEAPNWTPDGKAWIFNQEGKLNRLEVGGAEPTVVPTSPQDHCNNDHGFSPDGQSIAISDMSEPVKRSQIYLVPAKGGTPRLITPNGPSYWHGWSPDGHTLAFAAVRDGKFDIFTIPADGGGETRLTNATGTNDGPEYTRDGRWIYFNSERTGHMQIWRMREDGSDQEQFIFDETSDWFPHFSPDGQWMTFLAYEKGVTGHPPLKNVEIRLMNLKDKKVRVLATLFGGQGTINVPSWSPDSKKIAYVSYEQLPEEDLDVQ
jgi:WD40 repeat protein